MLESYLTIRSDGESEIEIKKSRFICSLKRVYSKKEAQEFIVQKKKEHWKANHNCSAFVIGEKNAIQHSSDDGEPSGTAGIPMLEVLKKQKLINVATVVTRYFGGTKLGTGGLIRAYSHAVSHALSESGLVEGKLQQEIRLTISYPNLGNVQNFIENNPYTLQDTIYGEHVEIICLVDEPNTEQFMAAIIERLNGQVTFEQGECSYHERPITKEEHVDDI